MKFLLQFTLLCTLLVNPLPPVRPYILPSPAERIQHYEDLIHDRFIHLYFFPDPYHYCNPRKHFQNFLLLEQYQNSLKEYTNGHK